MSVPIPFFSELPVKAIPAVQRLFDEVREPGCNHLAAYSDLVSRLNDRGVTPPPRAVVKRWVAGVQGGMIERPVLPDSADADIPQVPQPGYFESLPEAAMPALAIVWATVEAAAGTVAEDYEDENAFDAFFEAMQAIGHDEPEWRVFVAYAKAIRAGQAERPARQVAEDGPEADDAGSSPEEAFEAIGTETSRFVSQDDADGGAAMPHEATGSSVLPPMPAAEAPAPAGDAFAALRAVRNQLIADAYARLQADLRRQAERIVIDQLRSMADELEGALA